MVNDFFRDAGMALYRDLWDKGLVLSTVWLALGFKSSNVEGSAAKRFVSGGLDYPVWALSPTGNRT